MKPVLFPAPADFRKWLADHYASETEIVLQLRRAGASPPGITYAEALDEALCQGWIDGIRRSIDEAWFSIRFTPRQPRSIWSRINLGHMERLERLGRVTPAGRAAYERRDPKRTGIYSFESAPAKLTNKYERRFRAERGAWKFFAAQAPSYRRTAVFWVMSSKQEATRQRRLAKLIAAADAGRRILW